jgi:hypothetical protein
MDEQFHLLDLQIAKFTEFGACMIFPGAADLYHLCNGSKVKKISYRKVYFYQ